MMLDVAALRSLFGISAAKAAMWQPHLEAAATLADINTKQRLACFLAQLGHESGNLYYVKELWGPTPQQLRYEMPTKLAKTLGNTQPGDGKRFMGRGLIQVTGRSNYRQMTKNFGNVIDFEAYPEALQQPKYAALSAGMYWKKRNLNRFADAYDFAGLSRAINGGYNGLAHRQALYTKAVTLC